MSSYPQPLPDRQNKPVEFAPPKAVAAALNRHGTVKDAVYVGPIEDTEWGWYYYFSELIEWSSEGGRSVRITYYYAPRGSERWIWGGQYSIEDSPRVIKELLKKALDKTEWFEKQ